MFWDELHFLPESTCQIGTARECTWDEQRIFRDERHVYSDLSSLPPRIPSISPRILLFASSDPPLWVLGLSSLPPRIPGKQRGPKEEEVRYHQGSIKAKHQFCLTLSLNHSTKWVGEK
jgi:hypothetical protein